MTVGKLLGGIIACMLAATQVCAANGTQVADSAGAVIGYTDGPGHVRINVGTSIAAYWVDFPITYVGFSPVSRAPLVYYTTLDCSGTSYLDASGVPPSGWAALDNTSPSSGHLIFPSKPFAMIPVQSFYESAFGCNGTGNISIYGGVVSTITMPAFKPPLSLK